MSIGGEIRMYDNRGLVWSALVRHDDGSLESIGWDGNAFAVLTHDEAVALDEMRSRSFVITDAVIPCAVAKDEPRLDLLNDCPACA